MDKDSISFELLLYMSPDDNKNIITLGGLKFLSSKSADRFRGVISRLLIQDQDLCCPTPAYCVLLSYPCPNMSGNTTLSVWLLLVSGVWGNPCFIFITV